MEIPKVEYIGDVISDVDVISYECDNIKSYIAVLSSYITSAGLDYELDEILSRSNIDIRVDRHDIASNWQS